MKHTIDEYETENIELEETDIEGRTIDITNSAGYGGADIEINAGMMTWYAFDELKRAMDKAERLWRI